MSHDFWEDPERVEQFAEREPDDLVERYDHPSSVRVLDLGCAGGRNTVLLARRGFDVQALDASAAMVERARERVATIMGPEAATERVRPGRMDDLSRYGDGAFELVVALGVYHAAATRDEWERAVDETARILKAGGLLLFNQFTPEVDLTGRGVRAVPGEPGVYDGSPAGRAVLLDADALDAAWSERGLTPDVPSETVRVELERGRRVSVNALYRKVGA